MKTVTSPFGRLFAVLAVASLWLSALTVTAATKEAAATAKAVIVSVVGKAMINYGDGAPEPATEKMVLKEGATINTGANSKVILDLGENGQALSINANSTLTLDELKLKNTPAGPVAQTTLELKRGGLIGNTKKLAASSKYEVRTANGVAGIRGTSFRFLASGLWQCFSGLVQVSANGESFSVEPGKMLNFQLGNPPALGDIPAAELRAFVAEARLILNFISNVTKGFNGASIQQHQQQQGNTGGGATVDPKTLAAFEHFAQQVQLLESFVANQLAQNDARPQVNTPFVINSSEAVSVLQRFQNAGFLPTHVGGDFVTGIGGFGVVRGQLSWNTSADMDLHLLLPDGTHVYYGNTDVTFGGNTARAQLDIDNLGGVINQAPDLRVENIVVNPINGSLNIPGGTYQFYVRNFSGVTTEATLRYTADSAQNVSIVTVNLASGQQSATFPISVGVAP